MTKDAIKKAMKIKSEKRLTEIKNEFVNKFKNNEITWKKRLDYHKSIIKKEHERSENYLKIINDLKYRVVNVEKKNLELYKLIKQQKQLLIPKE